MKIKTETQTGSIVSFKYDDEIAEITGLTTSFEPKQDGTPWQSDIEQTPYLLRQSPQYGHDYDREVDTLIGGSIAWNQLIKNGNFATTDGWTVFSGTVTKSVSNNVMTLAISSSKFSVAKYVNNPNGHIVLYKMEAKASAENKAKFNGHGGEIHTSWTTREVLFRNTSTAVLVGVYNGGLDSTDATVQVRNFELFDLTQAFGTEIANYIYSLEQSTAGSGIAWLKSYGFLTKDYYAYNDGSLVSVKTSEHRTVGKNLLDKDNQQSFAGFINTATQKFDANSSYKCAYIRCLPNTTYVVSKEAGKTFRIASSENAPANGVPFINTDANHTATSIAFTTGATANYLAVLYWSSANGDAKTADELAATLQIEFGSTATAYEPYESHSYPLDSDLELRGIPKLSNGSLYYDGDEYRADGTVTRKYGIVDLGTIDWRYDSANSTFASVAPFTPIKLGEANTKINGVCSAYEVYKYGWYGSYAGMNNILWVHPEGYIIIRDTSKGSSASDFKTAMSGVYLVYELATPTTETADSFTSPQIVDPNGTEEYVDERSVPVPVGHRTTYMMPYPISGWDEVKAYVSPTEEEEDATIYTINLNGTRYGGTIDFFRGVMTLTHGHYAVTGNESGTWSINNSDASRQLVYKNMKSYLVGVKETGGREATAMFNLFINADAQTSADVGYAYIENGYLNMVFEPNMFGTSDDVKAWLRASDVELVYELATPLEVQLTAEQIEALQGQNYVWCDSGDTTLTWRHVPVLDEAVMLNGKYLELTIDGYSTLGTSGRRSLGRQLDTFSVGTADGETVKNSTFPSRKITVNYVIQTDTEEELTEAINQLANILNQDECDFVFRDESDKFFSGYGLLDSEPKKYRHAAKGTWSLYCAYPFKRSNKLVELSSKDPTVASVEAHSATFVFDYKGTLPARPILRAEFASAKSGGEYNEDGDCGYVAFLDAEKNIIQLGNPEVLDVDQYANATLINREFTSLSGWTASGVTAGDLTDQFWQNGKGQTQSYAKGTGSLTKSVTGAVDMEFDIVHRLCVSAANQTGKFECYAKNGNDIVVGFKIEKTGNGTAGVVSYILNNKVVGTDSIDLSYYNTHFGYCNRTARYVAQTYSVKETYYVKKKGKKKKKKTRWVTKTRQVQNGWNYTQSNLNSGWSKDGGVVVFSVGNLPDRTFKSSDIELTPSTSVVFGFTGSMHTNAVHSCSMLSKAGVPFAEIPNVFTAGDVVEGDCNSADVMLYRAGSLEGHLEPQYGALGNDWEDFEIKPGKNIIRAVWSDWVNTSYKPEIKIIFNEVYV